MKTLTVVGYTAACAIVALGMVYWPASAGNILTKINVLPAHLTSASENRVHKADRPSGVSFEDRWGAVPALAVEPADNKNRREPPQAEARKEKIPFSCELAFSRLVTKGNFSTRCIAILESSKINA